VLAEDLRVLAMRDQAEEDVVSLRVFDRRRDSWRTK
jgi:hypothetical protein